MKVTTFNSFKILPFLAVLLSPLVGFAQKNAAPGMENKTNNFASFSPRVISNLDRWKQINDPIFYTHPEFGVLPKDAPCQDCVEDFSKRKLDERYFVNINDPSSYYLQKAMGLLHEEVNGQLITIDHQLGQSTDGKYLSGSLLDQPGFDVNQRSSFFKTTFGDLSFNQWSLVIKQNGQFLTPIVANWNNYSVGEDGVRIENVFPGIDAEMRVLRGAIKTNFIIRENLFGVFDELIFKDQFTHSSPVTLSFGSGIGGTESVGDVKVFADNNELAFVQQGILYAQNGPKDLMLDPVYRIENNVLGVVVPYTWINENIDDYKLVVDPLVTGTNTLAQASILGSQYNASCNFTNSCNATLVVPRPANSTITDVQWTFNYLAQGACWREDGAVRFATGGCVSPAAAGFYWFCNLPSGGNCNGANVSIMSDLGSCLPAPSCVPVNVTFTMQFFRACWGSTGCNNTCIGAASPWTMTITGKTLEFNNLVTPVTLSATTVCQGGSINASTLGSGGVPGYTYNWSFSPTGTPSVGAGASATITFPTSGSITLYSIVTDACGNQVTSSRVVTVTPGPTATATPNSQTICTGQATGIALTSSVGGTTYNWTVVQSGVSGAVNGSGATIAQTLTATGAVAGTATYTITPSSGGCVGNPITVVITVNPTPVINVPSTSTCAGGSAVLTASGGTTYSWSPSATLSAATGTSVTATPTGTTTYTIVGTVGTCTGTTTATVTIVAPPVVTVNAATICLGTSATLTASGATTYTWTPAGSLSSGTGSTVTATPTVTTTYTITGTTGSCSSTANTTVTVNPTPVVTVNSANYCVGGSAVLTANGATTYSWSPGTNLSATTGASVTANPSASTTYTVTGTTNGCTGSAIATITVNPNPVVTVNSATICSGTNTTLTASGATTYTWTPSATLSSGTGASVTASPTTTTTYTIVGTTGSCTGNTTATVTVNPNPVLSVNSPTICSGQTATLSASGATTYVWSPATNLSATTGSTVIATPITTITYTVTGTTNGCSSSVTSTVTVNPIPVITVNSGTICGGASFTLNASGSTSYVWSPAATLSSSTGATVVASPSTTTTYTVTGTSNGCSGSNTTTVTVNPNPNVTVNSVTICAGATANLTANGADTYSWSPAASLSSPTGTTVTASPAGTTTYTVVGTTNGCTGTATSTVTVNANPVVTVNSGAICAGNSLVLNASGASTYTWSPAIGLSSTTGASVTANPVSTTTYTITGLTNGCSGTASATVTVNPIPTVSASNNGPVCPGQSVTFSASSTPNATFSWSGPSGYSSNQQNPVISNVGNAQVGNYTVTITLNGCSSTATTGFALIPGASSAIIPSGPFCSNDLPVNLQSVSPGGTWSGSAITNPVLGTFDPSLAVIGVNPVTYEITGACGAPTTVNIQVNGLPVVAISASVTSGCSPLAVTFTDNTNPISASLEWDFGNGSNATSNSPTTLFTADGCYDVVVTSTDINGCSATEIFNDFVCVLPLPNAAFNATPLEAEVVNPNFQFINGSTNAVNYSWNFGDGGNSTATNPNYTYSATPGSYTVTLIAFNAAECSDTTRQTVSIAEDLIFYVPNAFTPNGDEHNNTFTPVFTAGIDEQNFNMTIFNRWGEIVFETFDTKVGWDGSYHGKIVQEGIYTWTIRFKSPNNDKKNVYNGSVLVVR